MKGDSRPPRILDQIIEMMFPFAALGCFDFHARLLPIQSIHDTKNESSKDSLADPANRKSVVINAGPQGFRINCPANSGGLESTSAADESFAQRARSRRASQ